MSDIDHIKKLCLELIHKDKRKIVFEILDLYYDKAKKLPDFDVLGQIALKADYHEMYLKAAEGAYCFARTKEEIFVARTNLYKAYNALNYPEKALFYIQKNLEILPNDFDLHLNRAYNLALLNKKEEAEKIIERLIAINPEQEENIRFSLSGRMLRNGETAKGIINFIDTFKPRNSLFEDTLKMKKWVGGIQPGKTIYVNGEGGVGDEFINIRFLKHLQDYGMKPILYSSWNMFRPDTLDLFRRHGYEVIADQYSINSKHLWTNMMPLPGYLGLNEDNLWYGPYLKPLRNPKNNLQNKKFKIGIKCNGNPYFSQDVYRCIPIDLMLSYIPKNDNIEIYYFDKEKTHPDCINLKEKLNTWEDTLDYLDQMNVLVSSCTSVVHASGAMDKRTIVMVPIAEYYVWTSTRKNNTTPWYSNNMTVLKQTKVRSWHEPLQEMSKIVKEMVEKNYENC